MQILLSLTTFSYDFERKSFGPYPPRYTLFVSPQHEVVSTLKAKITRIFSSFSDKKAKNPPGTSLLVSKRNLFQRFHFKIKELNNSNDFFGERCYSNQYDEISDDEISDNEISDNKISDDELSGSRPKALFSKYSINFLEGKKQIVMKEFD